MIVSKDQIINGLRELGIKLGMELEVHSSLSSFGYVEGGAATVIQALQETVGLEGSIFMPALRLSPELPLTETDRQLGILRKIAILPMEYDRSAMGLIADTFRRMEDVIVGDGIFRIAGWGKQAERVVDGLQYLISKNGKALLLGVDIYSLTAMHYVEANLPERIKDIFSPSKELSKMYPADQWLIETGEPPVKAWYTIQDMAYERDMIQVSMIGECRCMFFDIWDVVGLYEQELKKNPYKLYGLE